jgi:hypothetical protein
MGQGSAMEQGYAGCFKGVGGVFFFSSGVVSGIVQYTIFCFVLLDDHCFIIILKILLYVKEYRRAHQ